MRAIALGRSQRQRQSTGTRGDMGSFRGAHGERVEREPITGVWGQIPHRGLRTEPLTRGSGGLGGKAPEAESFLALGRATNRADLYPMQYFQQSITIR